VGKGHSRKTRGSKICGQKKRPLKPGIVKTVGKEPLKPRVLMGCGKTTIKTPGFDGCGTRKMAIKPRGFNGPWENSH